MIRQVTESLEAFLTQPGLQPPLKDADIRFDRPTDPYALQRTTVNLFLYEVRENLELRSNEPAVRRSGGMVLLEPPPYRASCTYLVTAWPAEGNDLAKREHEILSQVLQLFARTPTLPSPFLSPPLELQEPPLPMVVVQPDGVRNPAEFWAAIGNRIKASVLLSVTVSLPVFDTSVFPPVASSEQRFRTVPSGAPLDSALFRIAGSVVDAATAPVTNASVLLVERGRSTLTDERGQFTFSAIPVGNFTLRVVAGAVTTNASVAVPATAPDEYDVQLP